MAGTNFAKTNVPLRSCTFIRSEQNLYCPHSKTYPTSVPLSNFLPYGPEAGDITLPPGDDESSNAIPLSITFPFMNHRESVLFVNINGLISFNDSIRDFKPNCKPLTVSHRMVAPFWTDIITNNELGGQIYFRQTTDTVLLRKVDSLDFA